jgi:hypothetical protein
MIYSLKQQHYHLQDSTRSLASPRSQNKAFNKDIVRHNQLMRDLNFSPLKVGL